MNIENEPDKDLTKSIENEEVVTSNEDSFEEAVVDEETPSSVQDEEAKSFKKFFKKIIDKARLRSKFLKKLFFLCTILLIVIFIIGYLWLCFVTERVLKDKAIYVIEDLNKQGFSIKYDSIDSTYYPFSSGIYINNLSITAPSFLGNWRWEIGKVSVSTTPFSRENIAINAKGMQKIYFSGEEYSLQFATKDLGFKINMSASEDVSSFIGTLDYSMALSPQNIRNSAVLASVSFVVNRNISGNYDFNFILKDLQFPNLEKELVLIDEVRLNGYINDFELKNTIKDTLLDWQKSDGSITFRKIKIDWDKFQMQGEGNLTLDLDMQPVLAGIARMKGFLYLVNMLEDKGLTSKKEANIVKIVYEQSESNAKGGVFRTLFSIQHNKLYIGYLPLLSLPPLPLSEISLTSNSEERDEGEEEAMD